MYCLRHASRCVSFKIHCSGLQVVDATAISGGACHEEAEDFARSALAFPGKIQVYVLPPLKDPRSPACAQAFTSLSLAALCRGKMPAEHDTFSILQPQQAVIQLKFMRPHPTMFFHPLRRFSITTSGPTCSSMLANAKTAANVLQPGALHKPRWFGGRLGAAIVLRDL